jgi:hypothetical protein
LQEAIRAGLAAQGLTPRAVLAEEATWPSLKRLEIDLSGASVSRNLRPPAPGGGSGAELAVAAFALTGAPLLLEGSPAELRLTAQDAVFRDDGGWLTLERSGPGRLSGSISRADLQKVALVVAQAAAAERGAQIQDLQLTLEAESPRVVRVVAEVTAKMGFMKASLTIKGRAELETSLQIRLSEMDVQGHGMAASIAAGLIRAQLEKAQQTPISLSMLQLGTVRLRDVRLTTGETIRLEAEFAS